MEPGTEHPTQPADAASQQGHGQEQRIDWLFRRQDLQRPDARAASELQRFLRTYRLEDGA